MISVPDYSTCCELARLGFPCNIENGGFFWKIDHFWEMTGIKSASICFWAPGELHKLYSDGLVYAPTLEHILSELGEGASALATFNGAWNVTCDSDGFAFSKHGHSPSQLAAEAWIRKQEGVKA